MNCVVTITRSGRKDLKKVPRHILSQFELWVEVIETEGFRAMQEVNGYKDHPLHGDRKGQRSSYLSRSWRVIYTLDEKSNQLSVEVLEVNHHEY